MIAKYAERLLQAGAASPYTALGSTREDVAVPTATIEEAIAAIAAGRMVVVVDDEDRENEGDLIVAAEYATPEVMAFFVRHTSGLICASITSERADELDLPLMVARNTESQRTAFTVTVDYRMGTTTGISATDRSLTARALVDPETRPEDLARPGHLHVLRAREGGVLKRAGHTEAAVDLARLAGLTPAGVLCEVVTDDGLGMARLPDLERLRRPPRPAAGHHRRPHPPPPPAGTAGAPHRRGPTAHRVRRVPVRRLPERHRPRDPPGLRDGRARRPGERAGAGAQRMPDRRRVRFPPLRLRRPAARRPAHDRRRRPGRGRLPARPRGPGHRDRPQAAGLRAAGRRPGHGRRQRGAGLAGRQPRVRHRRPDPRRPGDHHHAAA